MKYIIKNCPAIKEITTLLTSEPPQFQKEWHCCTIGSNLKKCKDITDCLLKRIVEKCKYQLSKFDDEIKNGNYPDKYKFFKSGRSDAGKEILELLEIEECENE